MEIKTIEGRTLHTLAGPKLPKCTADLRGLDLARADLSGQDLSHTDLSETNLCGADLWGSNLNGVDLSGALLHGANLADTVAIDGGCTAAGVRIVAIPHGDAGDPGAYIVYAQRIGATIAATRKYAANDPELCARLDMIEAVIRIRAGRSPA